ncbi:MAG: hypothetical protein E5X23_27745 [Mesorhizobium sp.]|uniref:hypothetical protein n=1 Tax=unclassified Mesorhizobium TaxID=325217 RepID=UPI000F75364C|nr:MULTISPECIES: hypothetical protein [unclassified Mesorhizobium]TGV89097.1 hypothetical protein EN801_021470 [Mesorhizobium sp. M00.F.Ca.ET.158.01.1.1]AZO61883.1 hypothetical protein EJ078_23490 [Mesorhizobium sp. M1A.F.Ca.IN.022.06.1.1]MCT2580638.1 hypothetical protein [Mesorhizobium sp. P13.3]MDF3169580.1 hypothetical protein [Mesorhizobium sp. P16.1]MDF3179568.1 hypothetical protein [Mesorhizobium sp. P17.1]
METPSAQSRTYSYSSDHPQRPEPPDDTYAPSAPSRSQSATAEARQSPGDQQNQIGEIRASLREFREAVRVLTESRSRCRYF